MEHERDVGDGAAEGPAAVAVVVQRHDALAADETDGRADADQRLEGGRRPNRAAGIRAQADEACRAANGVRNRHRSLASGAEQLFNTREGPKAVNRGSPTLSLPAGANNGLILLFPSKSQKDSVGEVRQVRLVSRDLR